MVLDVLSNLITDVSKKIGYDENLKVIKSNRLDLCDYQCDEVFRLSKIYHKSPIEIGTSIIDALNNIENFNDYFEKVEFCKPGFINMTLSNKFINKMLKEMALNDKFNMRKNEQVKTFVIDYGGPNVAKPLHVGHMRPAIIGESIKRIINYVGHKTIADVHLGDIGLPIGEVIYKALEDKVNPEDLTLDYLNKVYPLMSAKVKTDEDLKNKCAAIIKDVQEKKNYLDYWKVICDISVNDIKRIYKYLDVSFDLWLGESDAYNYIPKVKELLIKKGLLEDSQGAKVVFVNNEDDKINYPPLIFEKSNGAYLYDSSELGTVCQLSSLTKDTKLLHLPNGTINGIDGKPYKTRSGDTPKLDDLFKEVRDIFISKKEENKTMPLSDIDKIVNSILKFADLQNSRDKDYIFDINKFSDTQGKTGPYILYTYLRINKIIEKYSSDINKISDNIYNNYDRDLRIAILDLHSSIDLAFKEYKPSYIAEYVYNLCVILNSFYQNNHIANIDDEIKLNDLLSILKLSNKIIKEMLNLLIIDIPKKM